MIKKLLLIAFIFLGTKGFAAEYELSKNSNSSITESTFSMAITPVLLNFRIENSNKNRVYFDSSEPLTNLSTTGFIISSKNISSVTINSGQTTGHYFTVSSAFTFWDNNTIRLENGDGTVNDFTLSYIKNNVPEPDATANTYYVATNGSDSNNGLSEGAAFKTIEHALDVVSAGSTVYIKAGTYTDSNGIDMDKNGTATNPIKLIGYKTTPDDITSNYFTVNLGSSLPNLDATEMPILDGNLTGSHLLDLTTSSYIIIKNMQFTNGGRAVSRGTFGIVLERCNAKEMYGTGSQEKSNFKLGIEGNNATPYSVSSFRLKDCVATNSGMENIHLWGSGNLVENCIMYNDKVGGGEKFGNDYYCTIIGDNNIVRNSIAQAINESVNSSSHGFTAKASQIGYSDYGRTASYNLFELNYSKGHNENYASRNDKAQYNVFKDNEAAGFSTAGEGGKGISNQTGANNNIYERMYIHDVSEAFRWRAGLEEGANATNLHTNNNIIRNCIVDNVTYVMRFHNSSGVTATFDNNKIYNCTINNATYMSRGSSNSTSASGNELVNCIVNNITNKDYSTNNTPLFDNFITRTEYNNFWNIWLANGTAPNGANNESVNPQLSTDLKITSATPSSVYDGGVDLPELYYDANNVERVSGKYSKGAYDNEVATFGSTGPDVSICNGESTTLVASGGTSYVWNTGETTASITVNPTTTTTYTVTISDGTDSGDHDIVVTVSEPPSVNAGSDVSICSGEDTTLTATGEGNFLWSTGETTASITISPNATTTYTVTASNSCSTDATDEVIVTVNPGVTLDAGSDISICSGESATLTATGNGSFQWSTGETTASITVNPSNTTTYTVTSSNGNCSATDDVIVTVNQPPSVNAGSDVSICSGEDTTLTATGEGNFLWSTGETTASITISPNATTTYTVTASNSCSTDATDEVIVTVNPGVTLDAGSDISICSGESATLTVTGNGSFQWSTGETTASITVNPSNTTTYTVTSSNGNCSATDDVIVTVNQPPSVNAGSDVSICSGEDITLTATGEGNFLWSTGETTASITISPSSTTTYTVTATSNGCVSTATDDVIVTVNEAPIVTASDDVSIENGESTTLTATGTGNFVWSNGETGNSITVNPTVTTTYIVTASTGNGCSVKDDVIVTVTEIPEGGIVTAFAGEDISICQGKSVQLSANGGESFLWSTGETEKTIIVQPEETTIYSVKVTSGSSSDTDHVTVFIGGDNCNSLEKEMLVYPNPTEGLLNIELTGFNDKSNISLFNLKGAMVYSENFDNQLNNEVVKKQINLSRFAKGIYFVRLDNNGKSKTKKVLVI